MPRSDPKEVPNESDFINQSNNSAIDIFLFFCILHISRKIIVMFGFFLCNDIFWFYCGIVIDYMSASHSFVKIDRKSNALSS